MANTQRVDTHSFAAGFLTASIFFMLPVLLVPSLRAQYLYYESYNYTTYDVDGDGVDDAYDASLDMSSASSFGDEVSDEAPPVDAGSAASASSFGDGVSDEAPPVDAGSFPSSVPPVDICNDGIDNDGDGPVDGLDSDCDSEYNFSSSSSAGATEDCGDGIDNDGDGMVDMLDSDCM